MRRASLSLLLAIILASCASPAQARAAPQHAGWGRSLYIAPNPEHPHAGVFGTVLT